MMTSIREGIEEETETGIGIEEEIEIGTMMTDMIGGRVDIEMEEVGERGRRVKGGIMVEGGMRGGGITTDGKGDPGLDSLCWVFVTGDVGLDVDIGAGGG